MHVVPVELVAAVWMKYLPAARRHVSVGLEVVGQRDEFAALGPAPRVRCFGVDPGRVRDPTGEYRGPGRPTDCYLEFNAQRKGGLN